jgi:Protein of unknown function (DUF2742)
MTNINGEHDPPEREDPGPFRGTGTDSKNQAATCTEHFSNSSRQVSWLTVHEYIQHVLAEAGSWPMVGTPAWCLLADDDPVKIAAVYDAAQHWALRVETSQESLAQASRDVSAAADWDGIAQNIRAHNEFYAEKPWLRRSA